MPNYDGEVKLSPTAELTEVIADADFIRGGFRIFNLETDFRDPSDGSNVFLPSADPLTIFQDKQIVFAHDTHKLYQLTATEQGGPPTFTPASFIWTEFQFSGSSAPTGTESTLTLESLTIEGMNEGQPFFSIFSQSLDLNGDINSEKIISVGGQTGLLRIEPLNNFAPELNPPGFLGGDILHSIHPGHSHLIASSSAFYLSLPDLPNLVTLLSSPFLNIQTFEQEGLAFTNPNISALIVTDSFGESIILTNFINVESGQTFKLSFNVACDDPNFIFNFKIVIFDSNNIAGNEYRINSIGANSLTIASTVTDSIYVGFVVSNSQVTYQLIDVNLTQTGL